MSTHSTVKFFDNGEPILCLYQQNDGYYRGVGAQLADLLESYSIVNGIGGDDGKIANGYDELPLMYVLDNKDGNGNIYLTHAHTSEEYDYEVHAEKNEITKVLVSHDGRLEFSGTKQEFISFINW